MLEPKDDRFWDAPDDYFGDYDEYAKVVRTWFVAYGIGGPVLLLTNATVSKRIAESGMSRSIVFAFLAGVVLQVTVAIINKSALWACYKAARQPELRTRKRYILAHSFAYLLWVDILIDLVSLMCFGFATYRAFEVLV